MFYNQSKGKPLRVSERFYFALACIKASDEDLVVRVQVLEVLALEILAVGIVGAARESLLAGVLYSKEIPYHRRRSLL